MCKYILRLSDEKKRNNIKKKEMYTYMFVYLFIYIHIYTFSKVKEFRD